MFKLREACPGCGSTATSGLYEVPYSDSGISAYLAAYYNRIDRGQQSKWLADGVFVVHACEECGLIFQRQVPDDDFMAELYGNWLGRNDLLAPHQPQMPMDYYAPMAQEVLQIYQYLRGQGLSVGRPEVLDFGLGWGNWAQVARAFGGQVSGVELSPAKISHLTHLGFDIVSLDGLQAAGQRFDFINTEQVIEHLADPAAVTALLVAHLKPGGIIKLSVPDSQGIVGLLSRWDWQGAYNRREQLMPVQPLEHINCFTSQSLDRFASRFGLRRFGLPLGLACAYPADWDSPKSVVKGLLRPIKRHLLKRGCHAYYQLV